MIQKLTDCILRLFIKIIKGRGTKNYFEMFTTSCAILIVLRIQNKQWKV